mgnify:CR=1 FL=1
MTDRIKEMVGVLREWQGIERQAMNDTAEIMEETDNKLIRLVMEIIRHDSLMHHRVQQFLVVPVSREEVAEIWDKIEAHDEAEKKTIELAEQLRERAWSPVHRILFSYLLTDEKKHDTILNELDGLKRGMNQASGG